MRGGKWGRMLSIQDDDSLPLVLALRQVRQGAEAMPRRQLEQQLISELGTDWRGRFVDFDDRPFAAASIGQVHQATVLQQDDGIKEAVVKVQCPGVARSIESNLRNLSMLGTWTGLAPKGLFVENIIQDELKVEWDYRRELKNQKRIKKLVEADPILSENRFVVPDVMEDLTTDQVVTRWLQHVCVFCCVALEWNLTLPFLCDSQRTPVWWCDRQVSHRQARRQRGLHRELSTLSHPGTVTTPGRIPSVLGSPARTVVRDIYSMLLQY